MDQLFSRIGNRFLSSLSPTDQAMIEPFMREVDLAQGERLYRTGDNMEYMYFPHSGVVSIVVPMSGGAAVEVAMIGREGILGGGTALGIKRAIADAIVQVRGKASRVPAARLRQAAMQSESLMELVGRHEAVLYLYAQQSAACNALHSVESRMARWILEIRDRLDGDTMTLTQEFLADMIGVQRTTVTSIARKLQTSGGIECRRGHIRVANRGVLESAACECYERVRRRAAQLLPEARSASTPRTDIQTPMVSPPRSQPPVISGAT